MIKDYPRAGACSIKKALSRVPNTNAVWKDHCPPCRSGYTVQKYITSSATIQIAKTQHNILNKMGCAFNRRTGSLALDGS